MSNQSQAGETIVLGGGCFWCLDAVFSELRGVLSVECGYCNGNIPEPSYEQVCSGTTGHCEVVRVRFDPARIALDDLLAVFFRIHDPTTPNRQGHDVGTQYRSGIYFSNPAQQQAALAALAREAGQWSRPVVTEVLPLRGYWPAEEYHQNYYARHPGQGYCMAVIRPKVELLHQAFGDRLAPAT